MTEKDFQIYKDFMHYGKFINCKDFNFTDDKVFITMKVFELDGVKRLFVIRNGILVHSEII